MRAGRERLSCAERRALSLAAQRFLLAAACWRRAKVPALYMAVKGEVETDLLLQDAWESGKTPLLPLCDRERPGCMELVPCAGQEDLRPGYCGIPEPVCPAPGLGPLPDLIVTPGVAFDRRGFRLGMGGGFYDRLLARQEMSRCLRIGLAYAFQMVDLLPGEVWDMPVHALCSEKGILWIQSPTL